MCEFLIAAIHKTKAGLFLEVSSLFNSAPVQIASCWRFLPSTQDFRTFAMELSYYVTASATVSLEWLMEALKCRHEVGVAAGTPNPSFMKINESMLKIPMTVFESGTDRRPTRAFLYQDIEEGTVALRNPPERIYFPCLFTILYRLDS